MEKYRFTRLALFTALSLSAAQSFAGGYMEAPESFSWTGFIVGAELGWDQNEVNWDFYDGTVTERFNQSRDNWAYGGQVGYLFQSGYWVFGVQGDYVGFSDKWMVSEATQTVDDSRASRIKNAWLVTPSVGVAQGRWYGYVRGGYANGKVDFDTFITSTGAPVTSSSSDNSGWTVGVGGAFAFATNWVFGVEYNHIDLDVKNRDQMVVTGFAPGETVTNVDATSDVVMARLSYKA